MPLKVSWIMSSFLTLLAKKGALVLQKLRFTENRNL